VLGRFDRRKCAVDKILDVAADQADVLVAGRDTKSNEQFNGVVTSRNESEVSETIRKFVHPGNAGKEESLKDAIDKISARSPGRGKVKTVQKMDKRISAGSPTKSTLRYYVNIIFESNPSGSAR